MEEKTKKMDELKKLFDDEFMKKHTEFKNFEEFLKEYEYWNPVADMNRMFQEENAKLKLRKHTKFKTWEEMLETAHREHEEKKDTK